MPTDETRWLRLTLAYDGTDYAGWQEQPDRPTVQLALERAIERVTGRPVRAAASGRTDAGVHALGQEVSVRVMSRLPCAVLCRALNATLPRDIRVRVVRDAPRGFHARRDAVGKTYGYRIDNGPVPDLFRRRYAWHVPTALDDRAMDRAARPLRGRHDFRSFESRGSPRRSSVRTITRIGVHRGSGGDAEQVWIDVRADGFLYKMVRAIVGTLVEVGRGARPDDWPAAVLRAASRSRAGPTAPPHGLFLVGVDYPFDCGGPTPRAGSSPP